MKHKSVYESPITVINILKKYVFGKRLFFLSATLLTTSLLTFVRPLIIKGITDDGMLKANMQVIVIYSFLLLCSAILEEVISILQSRQFVKIQNTILLDLYQQAFDKLLKLKKEYFTKHNNTEIINRISTDINSVGIIADRSILFMITYVLSFVGGVVGLFVLNYKMAIIVLLVIPLKAFATIKMSQQNEKISSERIQLHRSFSSWFGDIINGVKEIKLWNLRAATKESLSSRQKELLDVNKKSVLCSCYNQTYTRVLDSLVQCTLYVCGGFLFLHDELSLGSVTAFISYSSYVLGPITSIMSIRYMFSSITPSLKRLNDFFLLDEATQPRLKQGTATPEIVHSFELVNISFSHTADVLLKGVSLKGETGDRIAIIGPNGSGKSTLIDLILRFETPHNGKILINGKDAFSFPEDKYWNLFAVVEQEPYFFKDTIRNNLDPRRLHTDSEIIHTLEQCGALPFFQNRCHGDLNEQIHFDANDLSGGERKKMAVARAILKDAPIIIMDEAASDYDAFSEMQLSKMITQYFHQKIILYITHNYNYLDIFSKVYQISNHTLCELSHEQIYSLKKSPYS